MLRAMNNSIHLVEKEITPITLKANERECPIVKAVIKKNKPRHWLSE
jgi:hypothetical protein